MAERNHMGASQQKRLPPTHFLCLPLVNSVSLPQLESSLATFRSAIPLCPEKEQEDATNSAFQPFQPLIPNGALRPVGTLHLTLGVMSLPTKERQDEAFKFFQSLDLVSLMHEAEELARSRRKGNPTRPRQPDVVETEPSIGSGRDQIDSNSSPQRFTISLESLHALPRTRFATVLHAAPVDSSSRLYPFCVALRDRFLDAGFLQEEYQKNKKGSNNPAEEGQNEQAAQQNIGQVEAASPKPRPQENTKLRKRKIRPLLLHATVVNTVYVRGRRRPGKNSRNHGGNSRNNQYSFDARDILHHYRNYYTDGNTCIQLGSLESNTATYTRIDGDEISDSNSLNGSENETENNNNNNKEGRPFVWAKDFPLQKLCICEMGAKKLDSSAHGGLGARLGEEYRIVSERSLLFDS
ncbi:hypothetical protein ASPZODRAFT_135501 [Penicilliopsis zonata CBS 506.65]|uniref:A-kinase anchor protein 7-like phosphoesterase domain-containing protein n=1 Tax=Penicilliopsis zonata CBS 506.65 TaxID=1073090 RepID=A0A1L9SAA7_9EURO|nr:hypothetical protein ASPZODRAFT_135501 [Penicilliopsis zonata CBS 506.65]OJJ44057.1 hypothetical protein ASPZODRAFT_135501 [Penicilliopsis zonata CBS 506.65]